VSASSFLVESPAKIGGHNDQLIHNNPVPLAAAHAHTHTHTSQLGDEHALQNLRDQIGVLVIISPRHILRVRHQHAEPLHLLKFGAARLHRMLATS
jgi:hypothetical protein